MIGIWPFAIVLSLIVWFAMRPIRVPALSAEFQITKKRWFKISFRTNVFMAFVALTVGSAFQLLILERMPSKFANPLFWAIEAMPFAVMVGIVCSWKLFQFRNTTLRVFGVITATVWAWYLIAWFAAFNHLKDVPVPRVTNQF